jgi:alkaline phosphatase D
LNRRDWLVSSGALALASASVSGVVASDAGGSGRPRRPETDLLPTRIAFGSCAKQDKPQPIWDAVLSAKPDLFIFLGDNVYGDTRDMEVLREKYARLAAQPGFRRLTESVPVLATWDDHDYGENNAGADYPQKEASRSIFCDFWGEPPQSLRRTRDGIYDAVEFVRDSRRLQIILPDLRFNRTAIRSLDLGGKQYDQWAEELEAASREVPGPYERNPDAAATMLGERQWSWLEEQLAKPADVRIFASSLQVVADFPGWEAWINYADDHQRLLQALRQHRANGLFCISGDTHYAEVSRLTRNAPYPLWDFTSSGLTEVWPVTPPNSRRIGSVLREINFGLIELDWTREDGVGITIEFRDVRGEVRLITSLTTRELQVS